MVLGQNLAQLNRDDACMPTLAMLRANINRLVRRTWCTTKKPERLAAHIWLHALFNHDELKKNF